MKNTAITQNHLYGKAYRNGKKFVGHLICVYVLKDYFAKRLMLANPEKKYVNRLGLSVTKKLGNAVARNRTKRILRAAYDAIKKEGCLKTGFLVVISARQDAVSVKSTDVERELRYAFSKLEMLMPEKASGKKEE